jgi:hypothetical protein
MLTMSNLSDLQPLSQGLQKRGCHPQSQFYFPERLVLQKEFYFEYNGYLKNFDRMHLKEKDIGGRGVRGKTFPRGGETPSTLFTVEKSLEEFCFFLRERKIIER